MERLLSSIFFTVCCWLILNIHQVSQLPENLPFIVNPVHWIENLSW